MAKMAIGHAHSEEVHHNINISPPQTTSGTADGRTSIIKRKQRGKKVTVEGLGHRTYVDESLACPATADQRPAEAEVGGEGVAVV